MTLRKKKDLLRDQAQPSVLGYTLDRETLTPVRAHTLARVFKVGDRVCYCDVNLTDSGTVERLGERSIVHVRWDRFPGFLTTEWEPNLRHVRTSVPLNCEVA